MIGNSTNGSAIRIDVNGRTFMAWKSAQIVSGLDQIATQFTLAVTSLNIESAIFCRGTHERLEILPCY